jgi:hypothetical protein
MRSEARPGPAAEGKTMNWYKRIQPVSARDLDDLERRVNKIMATQQEQINAIATELSATKLVVDKTATNVSVIKTGIDSLKLSVADLQQKVLDLQAQNPALDLTALQAAANAVSDDVAGVETATESTVADLPVA